MLAYKQKDVDHNVQVSTGNKFDNYDQLGINLDDDVKLLIFNEQDQGWTVTHEYPGRIA